MKARTTRRRSLWLLATFLVVILGMVAYAYATEMGLGASTSPTDPGYTNGYYIGETVNYEVYVQNTSATYNAVASTVSFAKPGQAAPGDTLDTVVIMPPRSKWAYTPNSITYTTDIGSPGETSVTYTRALDPGMFDYAPAALQYVVTGLEVLDSQGKFTGTLYTSGQQQGPVGVETFNLDITASAKFIQPATAATLSVDHQAVLEGALVDVTITESNAGNVDLTGPFVDFWQDGGYLASFSKASPEYFGGDLDDDGILDCYKAATLFDPEQPAETWTWKLLDIPITATTTFGVVGHGTDPRGNDVTIPDPANPSAGQIAVDPWDDPDEYAETTVEVRNPCIEVLKEVSLDGGATWHTGDDIVTAYSPVTVMWKITVHNCGNVPLTGVVVTDVYNPTPPAPFDLAVDETKVFEYSETFAAGESADESGQFRNDVTATGTYAFGGGGTVSDTDYAQKIVYAEPAIMVEKEVSFDGVTWAKSISGNAPQTIHWRIRISNPGPVTLYNVFVVDTNGKYFYPLAPDGGGLIFLAEDAGMALTGELAPGAVSEWFEYTEGPVTTAGSKTNVATVTGEDENGKTVTDEDSASYELVVVGGPTRTVGFWAQHYDYTKHVFEVELGGTIALCDNKPIDSIQKVMAILNYDSILSKKEVAKMSPDEIKWMNIARQYVGAVLNQAAFGTEPNYMGEPIDFADVRAALCSGDPATMGDWNGKLDWFNNSGDMYSLYDVDPHFPAGSNYWAPAAPQTARVEGAKQIVWARHLPCF